MTTSNLTQVDFRKTTGFLRQAGSLGLDEAPAATLPNGIHKYGPGRDCRTRPSDPLGPGRELAAGRTVETSESLTSARALLGCRKDAGPSAPKTALRPQDGVTIRPFA